MSIIFYLHPYHLDVNLQIRLSEGFSEIQFKLIIMLQVELARLVLCNFVIKLILNKLDQ